MIYNYYIDTDEGSVYNIYCTKDNFKRQPLTNIVY